MKLLAVVVLYYPDETVLANIRTYLSGVDCLLLWDNTPGDSIDKERQRPLQTLEKSVYMSNGSNAGIGAALNGAVDYARQHGFTHLVTFDQDSSFASDDFLCYLEAVRNYGRDVRAIFSTNYFIKSQQAPLYPVEDAVVEVPSAMTSGSLYPLSLFDELGGFMSDLLCGVLIVNFAGGQHGIRYLHCVSRISCFSMTWDIRNASVVCWVRKYFPMNILPPAPIIMYVMVLCCIDFILSLLI